MKIETLAIHAGQPPDPQTGAVNVPIYQTSTYAQQSPGVHKGYEYSRTQNPTRTALEACLAAVEHGLHGIAFSSGMAALNTVMNLFPQQTHVICTADVYGGTFRLFQNLYRRYGMEFTFIDTNNRELILSSIRANTRLMVVETPTNPLLKLTALEMVSEICRSHNIVSVVDNTFASPFYQNPLDFGIDIVLHSTTKYIGGHSDVVGGALITHSDELAERLHYFQNAVGAVPAPMDCFLQLRGIKTLAVRMERHFENARSIAEYLEGHPNVVRVYFPYLESHPDYELARRQMRGMSGMISFDIRGGLDQARRFLENVRLFTLAESLGGVESLIEHPAIMTHASIPRAEREKNGITDTLIRLSVGIEAVDDLIADLDHAFAQI